MNTLGKILFWLGFIVLIGVVFAYLILIIAGSMVFATTTAALSICAILVVSGLLMLAGRAYEHKAARKHEARLEATITSNSAQDNKAV